MTLQPETQGKYAEEIAGYEALLHKELQNRLVKENTTSLSFILMCIIKHRPWCIFGAIHECHMTLSRFCVVI